MPINKFTTLLDLSRQAKILTGETATFDGKISSGIPFSGYPTGIDTATTVSLGVISTQTAVFSGGTGTTVFDVSNIYSPYYNPSFDAFSAKTWSNPLFSANTSGLTLPITILSADTQSVGPFWTLTQTGYTGEYIIGTQYTGYSITYSFNGIQTLYPSNTFSGFTTATQEIFSAGTLDYKGPLDYLYSAEDATIKGRLTTDKLTIQNGASSATTNYILTQVDDTGKAEWTPASIALSGFTIWTAGTGTNSAVLGGSNGTASGSTSVSEGINTKAGGMASHAEGGGTQSLGDLSHAEGEDTIASGTASHAEGTNTIASGNYSHAEGSNTTASADRSHAEGYLSTASGTSSHAEGSFTIAGGLSSHAEGSNTTASGPTSHSEGDSTNASGTSSHAEGDSSISSGIASHAEGYNTISSNFGSHAEGSNTTASGLYSHAEGELTIASNRGSHAEGYKSLASGYGSHAEGGIGISGISGGTASGPSSHAEGIHTLASGTATHAEGSGTTASGLYSHAEGELTIALGDASHAEGILTVSNNSGSHAEGYQTTASGYASHAEGMNTIASGNYSHSEGFGDSSGYPTASGLASHAEGFATTASGDYSHAQGNKTVASGETSHAGGSYSEVHSNYGFIHSYFSNIFLNSDSSAILGGYLNTIDKSEKSGIFVGSNNTISGGTSGNTYNMILGGNSNLINNHAYSTIINGSGNTIHFDILDFNKSNNFEMIDNSIDSVISASTLSKISSSDRMTITNSISSTVINAVASSFDPDPYVTSGGIIGNDDNENGVNVIMNTFDGRIRYKAISNTIIGSTVARIDGTATVGGGGAYSNFIGNSSSITISDQYNTSGHSSNNTVLGSNASNLRTPNIYSSIMGSSYVSMEYSDTSSIISSKDSDISTGVTSSIIGGTGHTISTTESSIILGGNLNSLDTAYYSVIAGGSGNTITKNTDNLTQPKYSGIFVGFNNKIIPRFGSGSNAVSGSYCAIAGGESNTISGHSHSFIGGGFNNLIECDAAYNAIVAGQNNINHAYNGVIIGGQNNTLGFSTLCPSDAENSIILGGSFHKIGESSNSTWNTAIIGGTSNLIDNAVGAVNNTVILGGTNITASTSDTVYAPNMIINTGGTSSKLGINTSTPEYVIDANGNSVKLVLSDTYTGADAPFKSLIFSGDSTNVSQIVASTRNYTGGLGYGLAMGSIGNNSISTASSALVGTSGDTYINSTSQTNNLNIINRSGGSGNNNIRMYAGVNSVTAAPEPDFHIQGNGGTRGYIGINTGNPQYLIDAMGTGNRLYYSSTGVGSLTLSATTGLPNIGIAAGTGGANNSAGISMGARSWDDGIYTVYGYPGDAFIYAGIYTNGLNIISNDGSTAGTGADYIRFYAGQSSGAGASNNPDLHIQGSGSSRGFVAINVPYNQDPTQRLDVNGNARFRSIGSSASAGALHYTSDGTLTTNTSDERLKTNIVTLTNALEQVKQLRGVKYNWTEEPNGDVRIGLIAQEVNNVVPELTFVNKNTEELYMGVYYDNVVALLIEAVKELSSGVTTSSNSHLETQTIPFYTPTSSSDEYGSEGNITRDDNYMYVKTITGWKRTNLESF